MKFINNNMKIFQNKFNSSKKFKKKNNLKFMKANLINYNKKFVLCKYKM